MHDVRTFHRMARLYDAVMRHADPEPIERGLAEARRPVETVVDVGGGTGRVARALDRPVIVVDAAPGMARRAAAAGVPTLLGDAARLPLGDGTVDAVVVVDAFHHFADPPGAVRAAHRALAPGGVLVLREFDPSTLRGRALALGEHLLGFDSEFRTPAATRDLLTAAGFEATTLSTGFEYTVVGVRPGPGDG